MEKLFIDGHNDTMMRVVDPETLEPRINIGGATDLHIDLGKLKKGGLSAPVFAAFSEGYYEKGQNIEKSLSESLSILNALYYTEAKNRQDFRIVNRVDEILENFQAGRISGLASIEGAYFIDEDNYREILGQLRDLKIKILGFNWNYSNYLGEGAGETYSDGETASSGGLTDLGKVVLSEMEKLGLAIDVSHMNEETFYGVAKNTTNPIIASHSGAYAIRPHRRNLKDEQLEIIRQSGGLVGVVLCSNFLKEGGGASLEDYMEHLNYIVDKIGIDHVGIGSDLDGTDLPLDLKDSSEMGKIVELLRQKYSEDEVDKILYKNFLRVFRTIESNEEIEYLDGEISLNYIMGENIKGKELKIKLPKTNLNTRIILDGILMDEFKNNSEDLNFRLDIVSREKFHILTIELENLGRLLRETRIVKIK